MYLFRIAFPLVFLASLLAQPRFDILLKGGHLIDPKNNIDAVLDVGISAGKIALVATDISSAEASRSIDVAGLYVVPGLVDIHIHAHVFLAQGHFMTTTRV